MSYIGSTPISQNFISGTDYFNGTGAQVAFTLSRAVNTVNDIEVIVNNVEQIPSGYTVSGTTLTFSVAPSAGTDNVYVRYLSTTLQTLTIPSGSTQPINITGNAATATTAINVSGTVAIANGGTGATTRQNAMDALAGAVTSGQYLRGNGTDVVMAAIVAADVPTLNQNTTGTAANVTGTVAIANGGTGQTTRQAAMDALAGATTSGQYLRGNGTDVVMAAIVAGDVPTLNQNTTGSSASCTGNAATATNATYLSSTTQTNLIVGKTPTVTDINSANDSGNFSVRGDGTYPASMSFHRAGAYAINVGLSTSNEFVIGGWSASSNAFRLSGSGALTVLGTVTAPSFSGSGASLTSLPDPTTAQVMSAIAASALNDVGSYAFARKVVNASPQTAGQNTAGTDLRYSDTGNNASGPVINVGTWRCLGHQAFGDRTVLWLRIS